MLFMMYLKKSFAVLVLLSGICISASAEGPCLWDVSAGLGTRAYLGEDDFRARFCDWWSFPLAEISSTCWITRNVGVGISAGYSRFKGIYHNGQRNIETFATSNDPVYPYYGDGDCHTDRGHNYFVRATTSFDLAKFKVDRIYSPILTIGAGILGSICAGYNKVSPTFDMGFNNRFHINPRWSINLGIAGALIADSFDGQTHETNYLRRGKDTDRSNISMDGSISLTAGITYSFSHLSNK